MRARGLWAVAALAAALSGAGCEKRAPEGKGGEAPHDAGERDAVVFKDAAGRVLTERDLAGAPGKLRWELENEKAAPPAARALHDQGRQAAGRKEFDRALELFKQAQDLAPDWAYPSYDAAFTNLLKGDNAKAEELYGWVDKKEPRGFFNTKTALDCLRRERTGALPPNFCKSFSAVDFMDDNSKKKSMLVALVSEIPGYPPAQEKLAEMLESPPKKMDVIEKGLAHDPDPETRGLLLLNKALVLDGRGDHEQSLKILGTLALDPQSTRSTEMLAKATLAQMRARMP